MQRRLFLVMLTCVVLLLQVRTAEAKASDGETADTRGPSLNSISMEPAGPFTTGDTITYTWDLTDDSGISSLTIEYQDASGRTKYVTSYGSSTGTTYTLDDNWANGRATVSRVTTYDVHGNFSGYYPASDARLSALAFDVQGNTADTQGPSLNSISMEPAGPFTTGDTITYTWDLTDDSGISSLTIEYQDASGRTKYVTSYGSSTGTTYTLDDNWANGRATVSRVTTYDVHGNFSGYYPASDARLSALTFRVGRDAPKAPGSVVATRGSFEALVSWSAPWDDGGSPITGYTITADPGDVSKTVSGDTTTATITGLDNGTSYTFTVTASNAVGDSPASEASNAVTPTPSDTDAPVVTEFDFNPKTVELNDGEKTVTVTARLTDDTGANPPTVILSSDDTSQTLGFGTMTRVSGNEKDGVYQRTITIPTTAAAGTWAVRLYPVSDTIGNSNSSFRDHPTKLTINNTPPATAPDAPTDVTATRGDKAATVSWTAAAGNGSPVTSYTITSTPDGITKTVTGDQTDAVIDGLTNGTSYTFTVVASNAAGTSPASSPSNAITPAAAPDAPTDVTATRGDKSAVVSWTKPAGNGSPLTGYTITSTPDGITKTVPGDTTTTTMAGLTNGTTYTFTVTATNAIGDSPASEASKAVTPAAEVPAVTAPEAPVNAKAKVKKRKLVVTWSAPATGGEPLGYRVTNNKGLEKTVPADKTKLVLRKVKPGKYKFRIVAENEAGTSRPAKLKLRIR